MSDTLLLNQDGRPLRMLPPSTLTWQDAVKALWLDKVVVMKNHDDWVVRSQKLILPVPSIVMTKEYISPQVGVNFNRKMVYLRDEFTCQYCGEEFETDDLTLDHVIPKSQGGKLEWDNVVTACCSCNFMKGAGLMRPLSEPRQPNYWEMARKARERMNFRMRDPAWAEYIGVEYNDQAA
jgi:5-methylcytosine-specific restriction endonuclease McrA